MSKTFKYTEVRFYFYKASDLGQTTTLSKHAFFFFFKVFGDQPWVFFGRNDAKAETPVLWPPHAKSWLLEKTLMLGGIGGRRRGDDRGWGGWMAPPTRWTWVWVNSRRWWWTGRPGVLQFMESQSVGHDWVTELNWTEDHLG